MDRRQVLGLPLLAACARRPRSSSPIRVLAMPYLYMATLYLTEELGYFSDEGLQVKIQENDNSRTAIPLLAGGQADAAFFAVSPSLINAIVRGARVRIVAGRQFLAPECVDDRRFYASLQAFPEGFHDLRQMKGRKVSLGRNAAGMSGFIFAQCLNAIGLTLNDVNNVVMDDKEASVLLAAGKLDVLLTGNDYDLSLTPLRDRVMAGPAASSVLPNFMYSYTMFGKRLLDDSPDEGVRFLRAFLRGARAFLSGKTPKFLDDLARQNGFDPKRAREACRTGLAADGHIQFADLQRFIDWSVQEKFTPAPVRAEELVEARFLKEARRE